MNISLTDLIDGDTSITDMFNNIWAEIGLQPEQQTALQEASHTLNRNIDALRQLQSISQALIKTSNPAEVVDTLQEHPLFERADVITLLAFSSPWDGTPPEQLEILHTTGNALESDRIVMENYALHGKLSRRWPVVLKAENGNWDDIDSQRLQALGTQQLISYPLVSLGDWFGQMDLHATSPDTWSSTEIQMLEPVVNQVAIVVSNMQMQEQNGNTNDMFGQLSHIAHELRTPLTYILGFSESLLRTDVSWDVAKQRDFLQTINQEAQRLGELIDDLMDFTRMEADAMQIDVIRQQFGDILSKVLPTLETITDDHVLIIRIDEGLPAVDADAKRIGQVLINLVQNAAKYAPTGTEISVEACMNDDELEVCVNDEGPGIPSEECESIFEPFERGSTTLSAPGSGLGLSICKGIITAHGGTIFVEEKSDGEQGATFCFRLPVA